MAHIGRLARRLVLVAFVPLLGGCDDANCPNTCTDLREFLGGSMTVAVWPDIAMTRWQVRVDLVRPPSGVVKPSDCHPLPAGTRATFNGAAMEVQGLGGFSYGGFLETCTQPRFFRTEPLDRRGAGTIAI